MPAENEKDKRMGYGFCGSCGAARTRAEQTFCTSCGGALTPTPSAHGDGTGTAPRAMAPTAMAPDAVASPAAAPAAAPVAERLPDYPVPVEGTALGASGGAGIGRLLGVGALVLALVLGGVVVWQVFFAGGGASSPEGAAEDLLDAIAKQDGVALISAIVPGEVEGLDKVYEAAYDRLEEEGYLDGDGLSEAVTVEFSGLEFTRDDVGDDVAIVELTGGEATVTWDPSKLNGEIADLMEEIPDGAEETFDLADDLRVADGEFAFLTVKVDGGWYVSLLGTYAEAMVRAISEFERVGDPDYDAVADDLEPITGKTPEDVVDNLLDAVNDRDASALLANLPEELGLGLRPYASVLEDALRDHGVSLSFDADRVDLDTEELDDGLIRVEVDELAFSGSAEADGEYMSGWLSLYGPMCYEVEDNFEGSESDCAEEDVLDDLGLDSFYVLMREVDDGYQLDPVATIADMATTIVEALPSRLIEDIVEEFAQSACSEFSDWDACHGYEEEY